MYGEGSISRLPNVCSHELLKPSALEWDKLIDVSKFRVSASYSAHEFWKHGVSIDCTSTCSVYTCSIPSSAHTRFAYENYGYTPIFPFTKPYIYMVHMHICTSVNHIMCCCFWFRHIKYKHKFNGKMCKSNLMRKYWTFTDQIFNSINELSNYCEFLVYLHWCIYNPKIFSILHIFLCFWSLNPT